MFWQRSRRLKPSAKSQQQSKLLSSEVDSAQGKPNPAESCEKGSNRGSIQRDKRQNVPLPGEDEEDSANDVTVSDTVSWKRMTLEVGRE